MLTIFADAESYYDKVYSLRNMTPAEYILDPRWETIGWSVAENDCDPFWLEGDEFADYLCRLGTTNFKLVTHNALFDACIVAWRYGVYPRLCVDTMSMARALLSHVLPGGRVSLENVGSFLGVGIKGKTIHNAVGRHLADIKADGVFYRQYMAYGIGDVKICRGIYRHLAPSFPAREFVINDMIIKMATRPQFQVDVGKLYEHLATIQANKQTLLDRVGVAKEELMSNDRFAMALQRLGVEPPVKVSPTTGKETWAFAKSDEAFAALEGHQDPDVQALHAARVGHKSTLEESRTQRFINVAGVTYDGNASWMPIPLRFSGAHTHRLSGDWKLNAQNLPSRKNTSLRQSLIAPPGYSVVAVDASQIEARLTAWLAGQQDLLDLFEAGDDVYSNFATDLYGVPVSKLNKETKPLRLGGKICILGLGFGMGPPKFQDTWRIQSADAGMPMTLELEEAERIVNFYRTRMVKIKAIWRWLQNMLPLLANGQAEGMTLGPCVFEKQAILLPTGLRLHYHDLTYKAGEWHFTYGGKRKRLYGGKLLENIVQALDRERVMDAATRNALRFTERGWAYPLAHQVHDELVYVVRTEIVSEFRQIVEGEMSRRPEWGPTLPLAAESSIGPNYGACK